MLQRTILYDRELLRIRHVACHVHDRRPSAVERAEWDSIVFPLRGAFLQHFSPTREVLAEPNHAMFFATGASHRISHPVTDRDECLALDISSDALRDAVGPLGRLGTHALLTPRIAAARAMLLRRLQRKLVSDVEVEEMSIEIVTSVIREARSEKPSRSRTDTQSRRRMQAELTRIALLEHPEEKWTLTALARRANTSAYHLARLFRDEAGVSIHQYQTRARILRAIDLLLDTTQEQSKTAHDLGFANHSHFASVFRRCVGVTPSEFRRRANTCAIHEARTNLTAIAT